jgi:murein DD-endopeptidase MepM/ murein hydrolase activator NlpD
MTAGLKARWDSLFPERHIVLRGRRRTWHIRMTRGAQLAAIGALCGGAAVAAHLATGYIAFDRLVAAKQAEVLQAEMSNADLHALVGRLQERLDVVQARLTTMQSQAGTVRGQLYTTEMALRAAETARDEAQARIAATDEVVAGRAAQLAQLGRLIESLRTELRQTDAQRSSTMARLRQAEADLQGVQAQLAQGRALAEGAQKKAQAVAGERDQAIAERDRLRQRVAELEAKVVVVATDRRDTTLRQMVPREDGGAEGARQGWGEVERLLSSTGVDVDKFMARFGTTRSGQGGPFFAVDPRKRNPAAGGDIPAEALKNMLNSLPLGAPLTDYQLESRFGGRTDPFNRQKSFHSGLDFSAPFRSPVYNTAPGTVVHAGWKSDYGKVVEIDHGSGIVTRYAHLHRTTVAVGQKLSGRQQIGLLGSTGRSSGPHVHYEILVNGTAYDPEKFLKVGKTVVPVAAK